MQGLERNAAARSCDPTSAAPPGKSRWQRLWPVFACGAGLYSDGYLNGVIGSVNTMLSVLYPHEYKNSSASRNVSSIAFAGTVVGQLIFGYLADNYSRKFAMTLSATLLIVFAALCTGSYGGGTPYGIFTMLTVCRFFLGIGIGGEYPAGSVAAAEATGEIAKGTRNRWFIFFTNVAIDVGFVVSAFVPLLFIWILGEDHLRANWRVSLGLGVVPPFALFFLRLRLQEPEQTKRNTMARAQTPYRLVLRFYWFRLAVVALIWFIYDFSVYSAGIYSSSILAFVIPDQSLAKSFGWNVVLNLFYIPGAFLGAFLSDALGPKPCLILGLLLQAALGFLMAGCYRFLATSAYVAAFTVVYGLFLTFGELGPGNNIGLLASKTCATAVRGRYYGVAAAAGKTGAFVGTYVFPIIIRNAGGADTLRGNQAPFWVSSALCVFSALLAAAFLPRVDQDTIVAEDRRFRRYLESEGWDVAQLGCADADVEQVVVEKS
ncbi:major facilitator superfamily domain-containing protein [Sphaerosporella brunnea]|uniref:Major facilitator superfamily domain-containing protein n=1 Tax=Sphaerosporella brunnea TaxID=1250544 RepID=A0A5J5EUL5_9PEZI|nr:major facilitator superfamily domain-containing protein [Sphaerosporella brunnea]